jgi:diguanylate cyclase (GGDEF)-like protein
MNPFEKLEALKVSYRKELPLKLAQIKAEFDVATKTGFNTVSFELFYRLIHNLVGSGATFGLVDVSETAKVLDNALRHFIIDNTYPTKKEAERFRSYMEALVLACQHQPGNVSIVNVSQSHLQENSKETVKTIYLVDDDPYLHEDLKIQLEHFGYKVMSFVDTNSFELAMIENTPDAVIIDIMFPYSKDEGIQSMRRLRMELTKPYVLFFISVKNDFATRANAVSVGSDGFITKPIDISSLVDKLDRLTQKKTEQPIRVLILDDEPTVAEYHASLLNAGGIETKCINDPMQVLDAMAGFKPDVLLTDFYMPSFSGLDVSKVIRQMDEYLTMPIIYLSLEGDMTIQSKAIAAGAEDFLCKPVDPNELLHKIKSKADRYKKMRYKIQHDSLTRLYNHTTITEILEKEISLARRYGHQLSFAMIDLDYFKQINDTYGHQAGDTVIKTLSRLLKQRVRSSDIVGRYGGEEFCVVLPHTAHNDAIKLFDEIRIHFEELTHFSGANEFKSTFSCGICQWNKNMDIVSVINYADKSMYEAKMNGRNKVC